MLSREDQKHLDDIRALSKKLLQAMHDAADGVTDDAPELLDMIAKTPNLDRVLALPPERLRSPAARTALVKRLRDERVAWENARREKDA